MYKYFVLVLVIVMAINVLGGKIPEELKEMAAVLHKTCQGETGVDEEKIQAASGGNFIEDQALKCYMQCIWEQIGGVDEDGTIDEDALIGTLPADVGKRLEPTIRKCGTKVGADPCDNAFLTSKCHYELDPEIFFVV